MAVLNREKMLESKLWLDQPGAHESIERRIDRQEITWDTGEQLHHFVDTGYLVSSLNIDRSVLEAVTRDVDRSWSERPCDLTFAYDGELTSMRDAVESRHRKPRYRLADLHSHSRAALQLYLNPEIFR